MSEANPMTISGEDARHYDAVSLSSFLNVNQGPLVSANAETGAVTWLDKAGETKSVTLGAHAIRIIRKLPYGR